MQYYSNQDAQEILGSEGILGRRLAQVDRLEFVHLNIAPGKEIGMHALPWRVYFHVLSGRGIMRYGTDDISARPGDLLQCEPQAPRGWRTEDASGLTLLVIKETV